MKPLIDATELMALQRGDTPLVLLDCSFDLTDTGAGERAYAAGHLPGAHYAHLDRDLSGPLRGADGVFRGRHPLPAHDTFAATAGRWGIGPGVAVVAYDAQGASFAVRAWWLLRWLGHDAVAVLDGGRQAWTAAGGALTSEPAAPAANATPYRPRGGTLPTIDAAALGARLGNVRLVDARAPERFRGDVEPLDARAGHIPGARNRFYKDNLEPDGRFNAADRLRAEWAPLVAGHAAPDIVHNCGSGVTASHNVFAMALAGLGDSVLYPGSWSEWSSDTSRPVAIGS